MLWNICSSEIVALKSKVNELGESFESKRNQLLVALIALRPRKHNKHIFSSCNMIASGRFYLIKDYANKNHTLFSVRAKNGREKSERKSLKMNTKTTSALLIPGTSTLSVVVRSAAHSHFVFLFPGQLVFRLVPSSLVDRRSLFNWIASHSLRRTHSFHLHVASPEWGPGSVCASNLIEINPSASDK